MKEVSAICFYLPQFYPTRVNDEHWGPGFTEWTNVARARPLFKGHQQPKIPGELGFYDLRYRAIMGEQIALAQSYGIYGFCFYYYRFGRRRELDLPVRQLLSQSKPNLPFLLCWANESWTRAWDGRSNEVIRDQDYSEDTFRGLVEDVGEAMQDPRYIRVGDNPVFLIYQIERLPEPLSDWVGRLRAALHAKCGRAIILGGVYSHGMTAKLAELVDFVVQFPPHRIPRKGKRILMDPQVVQPFQPARKDYFESYDAVVNASVEGLNLIDNMVPGICPNWDNSPRRHQEAHILVGSTPEKFRDWARVAAVAAVNHAQSGKIPHPFLFINAWNEWGEGAALEPSWANQRKYLSAFKKALEE